MCVVDVGHVGSGCRFILWFWSLTNRFHGSFYLVVIVNTLLPLTPHTVHPAFEDGTDTGFQNVGQLQFDAGEIPRRKYTIFIISASHWG